MNNQNNFLRTGLIAIALPVVFAMYSCNGCNNSTDSTTTTDTTSVSTADSTTMMNKMDVQPDTMPTVDTGGKGDQPIPPKKP